MIPNRFRKGALKRLMRVVAPMSVNGGKLILTLLAPGPFPIKISRAIPWHCRESPHKLWGVDGLHR